VSPIAPDIPFEKKMQATSLERSSFAQTAAVSLATAAALALLGVVLAYWTWVWLAPRPEPRVPEAARAGGGVQAASALFGSVQRGRAGAGPAGIAIRLVGVVAATRGRRGYAVLQLEAKENVAVREGEDVAPGIRLAEVGADRVTLDRAGIRETLTWPEKGGR
jgi:general secretion pathway protein C